jgi:hypothetical protein
MDNAASEKILCPQGVSVKTPGKNRQFQNAFWKKEDGLTTKENALATRRVSKAPVRADNPGQGGFLK